MSSQITKADDATGEGNGITARPEREVHSSFLQPSDRNSLVWRYMDLSKFLDLVSSSRLFLPRAPLLGDPFEGSVTKMNVVGREYIVRMRDVDPRLESYKTMDDTQLRLMFDTLSRGIKNMASEFCMSCWHLNEHESAAMWRLYSRSDDSVCIQTDYQRLFSSLPDFVYVGMVRYIDYTKDVIPADNLFNMIMHKRKSFEHEREVRCVAMAPSGDRPEIGASMNDYGMSLHVDLKRFIQNVYNNPNSPQWFSDMATRILAKLGCNLAVRRSSLSESPLY